MGSFNSGQNTIEDLKAQLNIVDVVSRVIPLKRAGSNYKGVCPFHNEKTPSFVVSEQKQIFTCFGCGATGDAIEFTKRYYNIEFTEAIERLARENGIEINLSFGNGNKEEKNRIFDMNRDAAKYFFQCLTSEANEGYSYMKKRGISDAILKKFGIGYAPKGWDNILNHMKQKGYSEDELIRYSLLRPPKDGKKGGKPYDYFRNRVIFPIINTTGKVVGFQSRRIDESDPTKYLNTLDNAVFHKKDTIFGLNLTKQDIAKEGMAILVEGNMDVISLYQAGVHNVGATCGTALNENQAKLLKRYTDTVCLCYDSDAAGQEADLRGIEVLSKAGLKVKVMSVTSGKDPDEYIKEFGRDAFFELVNNAVPATDFKLKVASNGLDISKDEDKIEYMKRATDILKNLSPVESDIYVKKISSDLRVSEAAIRKELGKEIDSPKDRYSEIRHKTEEKQLSLSHLEATIIKVMFINSDYTEILFENRDIFESELSMKIMDAMFESYGLNGRFDKQDILDKLDARESLELVNLLDRIVIAGNEETVLKQCINSWKLKQAEQRQQVIIDRLSLADEDNNSEIINDLTKELIEVQKLINSYGGQK